MDEERIRNFTMDLFDAVRVLYEAEATKDPAAAPILNRVLALLPELRPDPDRPDARQLPACRHLSHTLDLGEAGPAAAVARAVRELVPMLEWRQNPRYTVENRGADFMENYGWSGLGVTGSQVLDFGILLLGPGVTYPPTSYPSEGAFLVVGGSPEWKLGDEPWKRVDAGSILCRPENGSEGKRPGEEPMLALYTWLYH
jgi:hypothetical protein